jgi:NAD(P)H-dependent FMN reductase
MLKVQIIVGSTRPGRKSEAVAKWVLEKARARGDAEYALVDLASFNLPQFDEPNSPASGKYIHPHTQAWSAQIAQADAFVFVTPEYNHSIPGVLKNALDFLYREWGNKAAGVVGYGGMGGARAVEQLRLILGELQVADVRSAVHLSLMTDWEAMTTFKPDPRHEKSLKAMLDQVLAWAGALKPLRQS